MYPKLKKTQKTQKTQKTPTQKTPTQNLFLSGPTIPPGCPSVFPK